MQSSQCIRKRIEEGFGSMKAVAGLFFTGVKLRGAVRKGCETSLSRPPPTTLVRLPKLLAASRDTDASPRLRPDRAAGASSTPTYGDSAMSTSSASSMIAFDGRGRCDEPPSTWAHQRPSATTMPATPSSSAGTRSVRHDRGHRAIGSAELHDDGSPSRAGCGYDADDEAFLASMAREPTSSTAC